MLKKGTWVRGRRRGARGKKGGGFAVGFSITSAVRGNGTHAPPNNGATACKKTKNEGAGLGTKDAYGAMWTARWGDRGPEKGKKSPRTIL